MGTRVLAVGDFGRERSKAMEAATREAASSLELAESVHAARHVLAEAPADVLLVDPTAEGITTLCVELRAQAEYSQVPIIALCHELNDLAFEEVFGWGGDDALQRNQMRALVRRLRALPRRRNSLPPPSQRGAALIADSRDERRIILGRVLRNAGFKVMFARNRNDALRYSTDRRFSLVVASASLMVDPRDAVSGARKNGSTATWIVTCPPRQVHTVQDKLSGLTNVAVADGFAPAENVLFVANELDDGGAKNKRDSHRMLYGTTVAFRGAGQENDDFGFTYNVSESGVYVRTLAPPEEDVVWLELRPPRTDRLVRLEARVAWRKGLGPIEHATSPAGFGVAITDGSKADVENWQRGCTRFEDALM